MVQAATDSQSKYIYVTGENDSSLTVLSSPALTNTTITNNSALTSIQSSITQLQVPCDKLTLFGEEDIYLANPDGTDLTLFLHSPTHFKDQARWSPDGTTLAYEVYGPRSSPGSLWTVTADGLDHEQLASYYYYGASWDWLPDSRYIVYSSSSSMHPQSYSISLMAIKAGSGDYTIYEPPYSAPYFNVPEYSASDRISGSFPFDGVPLNVGDNEWAFTKAPGTVERRYFSPNLEWVILKLFERDKTVNYLARSNGSVVKPYPAYHSVAAETVCTTPDPWDEIDSHLAWTPDSRRIIFASHQDGQTQLWTLGVEDETETPIATFSAPGCPSGWRWSPDNRYATFSIATEAQRQQKISDIYVMAWPEGQPHLAVAGTNYLPKWSSRSDYVLLSADPRVVVWEARKDRAVMELDQPQVGYLCDWLLDGTRLTCPGFFWNVGAKEPEFVTMSGLVQWSPNGRWLADLDREGKLRVLDVETGQTTEIMTGVTNFTWSPRSCEVK